MRIKRAYKTELDPNDKQRTLLLKHAGTARFAWNWGLQRKQEVYAMNQLPVPHIKNPTAIGLHKELNKLKKTEYPWMYEVSKCAPQEALRNLDRAFENFFEGRGKYPKFKSKKKGIGSFRLTGTIKVFDDAVQLPHLSVLRLKEHGYIPTDKKILSVTVSEKAGKWFVSIQVEEEIKVPENHGEIVGVDLGIDKLATVSDGLVIENPKAMEKHERKKKRLNKEVSRKKERSNNWKKAKKRLARCEMRIGNIRKDAQHKATTMLTRTKSVIGVESLNVEGMLKNHNLAGAIADAGWGGFLRQMQYKAPWYGSKLVEAGQYFPSSKRCSHCGTVKETLKLSERVYHCEVCGHTEDRDLNSSKNLRCVAVSSTETENACLRREVAEHSQDAQCPPVIQESDSSLDRFA